MKTKNIILLALVAVSFFVVGDRSVMADDLSNPGVSATSVQYSALSGYARISADGTNALAQLVTEIARATAAETNAYSNATNGLSIARSAKIDGTNALAQIVIETNRARIAEAINATQWVGRVSATEIVATNSWNQATNALAIANSAFKPNATNLLTEGWLDVVATTNLVFISNGGSVTTSVAKWTAP